MKKEHALPTKIIDDFFEIPSVWRHYALKQEYTRDVNHATYAGIRTSTLDVMSEDLFHKFASKIMPHLAGYTYFQSLQVNFTSVDGSYGQGWIHDDEPKWNVAGIIYLNPNPPPNSGTLFYKQISEFDHDYGQIFFEELNAKPEDRAPYQKYKLEQKSSFRKILTVGNVYNRCVIFNPALYHSADTYFGDTFETSRLTINFFGHAK